MKNQNEDKTYCIHGHKFSPENTKVYFNNDTGAPFRVCLTCSRNRMDKKFGKVTRGVKYPPKNKGIEWLEYLTENNYISKIGYEYDKDATDELLATKIAAKKLKEWQKQERELEEKERRERDLAEACKNFPTRKLSGSIVL